MAIRLPKALLQKLQSTAQLARSRAYAPYSNFSVGAALLCADEQIIAGCNVENASFGLAVCAERNALTSAVQAGYQQFFALVVASPGAEPAPPCGLCLQSLAEFCEDLDIWLIGSGERSQRTKLSVLMRRPFRWKGAGTAEDARIR